MERAFQSNFKARMKRAGAAALMTAIAGIGFTLPAQVTLAQELEVTELDFWAVRDAQMSGQIALASEMGFFKDEGLDVTVKWIVSGTDVPSLAASGEILMTAESVYISAMLQEKGVDMRYMMPLSDVGGSQQVVLGPNVEVNAPADLEGKKIGMAAGAGVGMAITAMCEEYGVDCAKLPSSTCSHRIRFLRSCVAISTPWRSGIPTPSKVLRWAGASISPATSHTLTARRSRSTTCTLMAASS
jgi:hypothetical protein